MHGTLCLSVALRVTWATRHMFKLELSNKSGIGFRRILRFIIRHHHLRDSISGEYLFGLEYDLFRCCAIQPCYLDNSRQPANRSVLGIQTNLYQLAAKGVPVELWESRVLSSDSDIFDKWNSSLLSPPVVRRDLATREIALLAHDIWRFPDVLCVSNISSLSAEGIVTLLPLINNPSWTEISLATAWYCFITPIRDCLEGHPD